MTEKNVTTGQKVYITTWALATVGIIERVAIEVQGDYLVYEDFEAFNKRAKVFRNDWYTTLKDAQAKVLKMIEARRKSIAKELKHLDLLEIEIKTEFKSQG